MYFILKTPFLRMYDITHQFKQDMKYILQFG